MESGFSLKEKDQFTDASHPENKAKNRFLNILPFDKNRIRLVPIAGSRQSDYINASIIDGFQQKHAFIATQAPLENTVVDFWRMVLEQNVQIIVMLTKIEEKGQVRNHFVKLWSTGEEFVLITVHCFCSGLKGRRTFRLLNPLLGGS